jgi:hypothetical protein
MLPFWFFLVAYYDLLDGCHIPLEVSCLPSIGTLLPGLGPAMAGGVGRVLGAGEVLRAGLGSPVIRQNVVREEIGSN